MKFEGTFTAIVTPMLPDGAVDWDGFKKNVEFQIEQDITGIVPAGTTGESPTLNWEDHNAVVERTIEFAAGRCPIIAGAGSNSTDESLENATHAVRAGAAALLMVDCYYNGPSSLEMRDHYYSAIAKILPDVHIIPYVIPGRTGTALTVEDLAILYAAHSKIATVKEATGDLERMKRTRELCGDDFSILSGDDDLTFKMLSDPQIRANGVISVMSNVAPKACSEMVRLALAGDVAGAERLHKALAPLFGIVTVKVENERTLPNGETVTLTDRYRNPSAIKTLMDGLGMPSGPCRPPLGKMTQAGIDVVRQAAKQVWTNNPEILSPIADFYGVDVQARLNDDALWHSLSE